MRIDILTIKGWKILLAFLLIVGPMVVLLNYVVTFFDIEIVVFLGDFVILGVYFLYPMLVGLRLRTTLTSQPLYTRKSNISLAIDCCMIVIAYGTKELMLNQENELNIFLGIIGVLGVVGIVRLGSFPAHEIRSIELKRNAGIWEYASETFQMLYWPLGVLWMQPRVNRIANKRTITISE